MGNNIGKVIPESFVWTIEDFFSYPQDKLGYSIESPSFSFLNVDWGLAISPTTDTHGVPQTELKLFKSLLTPARNVSYTFGIRGRGGEELFVLSGEKRFEINNCHVSHCKQPLLSNVKDRYRWAPGGTLTVFVRLREIGDTCKVKTSRVLGRYIPLQTNKNPRESVARPSKSCIASGGDIRLQTDDDPTEGYTRGSLGKAVNLKGRDIGLQTDANPEDSQSGPSKSSNSLGTDKLVQRFKNMFLTGDHYDTIIKVQDRDFRVHKVVLVVRSPVFEAMFSHKMIESNTSVITIEDCNPETFREFLSFLYFAELENVSAENVKELYSIADKYQVEEVKSECVRFMISNMTEETIFDFISLAIRHTERELLKTATDYFVENVTSIILTMKWQRFHMEYPIESNELYIKAIRRHIPE